MAEEGLAESGRERLWRTALLFGAGVALWHALTAPGGLFWLDAGDFAAAACELGVPHSTGFPLYTLLGKLFCSIPFGSGAFRVALLSALCAGAASAVLFLLLASLLPIRSALTAPIAAVALIGLWTGSVAGLAGHTPDVYALHTALALAASLLVIELSPTSRPGTWLALGFAIGLGVSNHAEFRLFAPLLLVVAVGRTLRRNALGTLAKRLGTAAIGLAVGLLPYLYLPLAAARHPYHAWGQPDTWDRFWAHVTGEPIRSAFREEMLSTSTARLAFGAESFAEQAATDLGALLPLAFVGLWVLLKPGLLRPGQPAPRADYSAAALLVGLVLLDTFWAIAINPMGLRDWQNGLTAFALVSLLAAVALGAALERLFGQREATETRSPGGVRVALAAVLLVAIAADGLRRASPDHLVFNGSWGAEDLGFDTLLPAPEAALVLTGSEAQAASRLYLVAWGAVRPDLQALHRGDLSDSVLLWRRHAEGPFPLAPDAEAARWARWGAGASWETHIERLDAVVEHALATGRTVLWGPGSADESQGRWEHLVPGYPTFQLRPAADAGRPPGPRQLGLEPPGGSLWSDRWAGEFYNYLGTFYTRRGSFAAAVEAFTQAHERWPDLAAPLVNLGVLAARAGAFEEAAALATSATERAPLNATAWLNLARYRCVLGEGAAAGDALERGRGLRPDHPAAADVAQFIRVCPPP